MTVHAKPGSTRESVTVVGAAGAGSAVAGPGPGVPEVIVRVRARAVEDAANRAVMAAVAQSLGVRRSAVSLVRGGRARLKHLQVDGDSEALLEALARLPRESK